PRPRVSVEPSCSCVRAVERLSACASVLAQMKSTPDKPRAIMCSTALPPQPPTPMTLMTAPSSGASSMISNMMVLLLLSGFQVSGIRHQASVDRGQPMHDASPPVGLLPLLLSPLPRD